MTTTQAYFAPITPASAQTIRPPLKSQRLSLYRNPFIPAELICPACGYTMHDHYWIDGLQGAECVCPPLPGIEELEDKQEYLCADNRWLSSEVERLTGELAEARRVQLDEVTAAYLKGAHNSELQSNAALAQERISVWYAGWRAGANRGWSTDNPYCAATPARARQAATWDVTWRACPCGVPIFPESDTCQAGHPAAREAQA